MGELASIGNARIADSDLHEPGRGGAAAAVVPVILAGGAGTRRGRCRASSIRSS